MPLVLITRRENFAVHTDNQIQMTLQHLTLPIQRLQLTIPEEIIHSRGEELNFSNHAFSIGLDSKELCANWAALGYTKYAEFLTEASNELPHFLMNE